MDSQTDRASERQRNAATPYITSAQLLILRKKDTIHNSNTRSLISSLPLQFAYLAIESVYPPSEFTPEESKNMYAQRLYLLFTFPIRVTLYPSTVFQFHPHN